MNRRTGDRLAGDLGVGAAAGSDSEYGEKDEMSSHAVNVTPSVRRT